MTWQEFEKLHGIKLGKSLRKIYIAKVHPNAATIPHKITPERFWELAQANQKTINEVLQRSTT